VSGALAEAYGFGARWRKHAGGDEQVRKNVSNCIRHSVARLAHSHPALARHFLATIKTGIFCSYRPEHAIRWESQ
jgi:hypothetical protein